jgi:hypothetical protein
MDAHLMEAIKDLMGKASFLPTPMSKDKITPSEALLRNLERETDR